jgi:HAD superfamily hydrolase (TIGR01662 family)
MKNHTSIQAVTFDFGQTLAEMDTDMLARRLLERGVVCDSSALASATSAGWHAYNRAVREGYGGHPWKILMHALLETAGIHSRRDELVDWLWNEQPRANLWRKPIAGMIELVRELNDGGVPVAVVSNSEGRLAELIDEMGWSHDLRIVADSGRLGIEKPDAKIFQWASDQLGVSLERCVHVGDAWSADFVGALNAGMHAVLFRGGAFRVADDPWLKSPKVAVCETAGELRSALVSFGCKGLV